VSATYSDMAGFFVPACYTPRRLVWLPG